MLLLMSPWIVGFCVFLLYPLVMNVYLSLTHYDLLNPPRWIGLANYRYAFTSDPTSGRRSGTRSGSSPSACRSRCSSPSAIARW